MGKHARLLGLVASLTLFALGCQQAQPRPQGSSGAAASNTAGSGAAGSGAASNAAPASQASGGGTSSSGPTRVTIGVTETIESQNPYADSISLGYGIWCEVLGCLVTMDPQTNTYKPELAESWEVENPTTWVFHLRKDVKWQDGSPFTSADVVHSINRIRNDRDSKQKQNTAPLASVEATDDYTVRMTTKEPTASLLSYFADLLIITSKAQYDKFGPDQIDQQPPIGTGPYMFKELVPNQRLVIAKNPNWWGGKVDGPDEVVYRIMRETEVRVTALLNGEIQIAEFLPPHLVDRVNSAPNTKVVSTDSQEIMFLAMMPKTKPWDNKLVRQAVCYSIDRDGIIQGVLQGQGKRLDGPIGPASYAYNPNLQPRYTYDPAKAKQLLAEAGYPNGVDVDFYTPVGRYIQDKQSAEAMAAQMNAVGIRAKLMTPEWPTLWADVQAGRTPFYYMGRGSVNDPGPALSQYFETGVSPRIGYSNPQLDALFQKERASFDENARKQALSDEMSLITEEAPACFLWTINMLWGMAKNIDYAPRPDLRIFASDIRVH
ncbi:MAG TPA: ABC transporter substrate-binding protein [Chloroflexota bacterium]|nr:ABC transporter substrate-binding protein [Chloroflexota bacterium]